jgi:hypothetical protein
MLAGVDWQMLDSRHLWMHAIPLAHRILATARQSCPSSPIVRPLLKALHKRHAAQLQRLEARVSSTAAGYRGSH